MRELHRVDCCAVSTENSDRRPALQIPNPQGAVSRAADNTVTAKSQIQDALIVAKERAHNLSRGNIPLYHGRIAAATDNVSIVILQT